MYATIRRYDGGSEWADALVEHEDDIRNVISAIDGFRAYYLIRSIPDGPTTISVFEDEAGAEASTIAAANYVTDNLLDVSPASPRVTSGEVALSF
jgi:hypothetical protein